MATFKAFSHKFEKRVNTVEYDHGHYYVAVLTAHENIAQHAVGKVPH